MMGINSIEHIIDTPRAIVDVMIFFIASFERPEEFENLSVNKFIGQIIILFDSAQCKEWPNGSRPSAY